MGPLTIGKAGARKLIFSGGGDLKKSLRGGFGGLGVKKGLTPPFFKGAGKAEKFFLP